MTINHCFLHPPHVSLRTADWIESVTMIPPSKARTIQLFLLLLLTSSYVQLTDGISLATFQNRSDTIAERQLNEDESAASRQSIVYSAGLKTIVAMVMVDEDTVKFHGRENIDLYVLTLMSLVDEAYHHPSLGLSVEVWLRRVHYLSPEDFMKINFQRNASSSLNDFCGLANKIRHKSYPGERIDLFVLLTRDKFGPAGYAPVGSVCSGTQNCVMVQDKGLTSAYVLAHEIGHTLGMNHDGENNSCRKDGHDGKIMAAKVLSNYYQHYWSHCSRKDFMNTLLMATCLDEVPDGDTTAKKATKEYTYSYGTTWNLHDQCRQEFGNGFWGCPHMPEDYMCERISCKDYNSYSRGCVTKHYPAIPKTICGPRHWCKDFNCQEITSVNKDGSWSEWKEWSECSRTCGTGFQTRKRRCNNPNQSKQGKGCRGVPDEYRVCSTQECPIISDFRAQQCQKFNQQLQKDNLTHNWLPFENKQKILQCKLSCFSEKYGTQLVKEAKDGTFCSYENPSNRCFKGSCKEIGCDGVINSKVKEDKCGVCAGNGKDCKKTSDKLSIELALNEYHNLVILPKHARHIVIRNQYSESHASHFFALKNTSTDTWFLNSGESFTGSQQFVANGALFTYLNDFTGVSLKARGPLTSSVDLVVYSKSNKVSAKFFYRYFLHKDVHSDPKYKRYDWRFAHWSRCSKSCEKGHQYKKFKCMVGGREVEREKCSMKPLPVVQRPCNTQSCSFKYWWVTKSLYGPCSVTCGVGVQVVKSRCMGVVEDRVVKVSHKLCDRNLKPDASRKCFMLPCMRRKRLRARKRKRRPAFGADEDYLEDDMKLSQTKNKLTAYDNSFDKDTSVLQSNRQETRRDTGHGKDENVDLSRNKKNFKSFNISDAYTKKTSVPAETSIPDTSVMHASPCIVNDPSTTTTSLTDNSSTGQVIPASSNTDYNVSTNNPNRTKTNFHNKNII